MTNDLPDYVLNHEYKLANIREESDEAWDEQIEDAPIYRANLVTSKEKESPYYNPPGGYHRPLIDLDVEANLIPSSTPGHSHLYINYQLSWESYIKLLKVLHDVGIISPGNYDNALRLGYSSLRMPHIKKDDYAANNPFSPKLSEKSPEDEATRLRREIAELQRKLNETLEPPF